MSDFSAEDQAKLNELIARKKAAESSKPGETCKFHLANGDKVEVPFPKAREILMSKYGWSEDDFGDDVRNADRESDALVNRLTGE